MYDVNCPTLPLQNYINLRGLANKNNFGDYKVEFFREYEAEFKKALARETGAQGGVFDEKNRRSKIS
jgi:hypothetical protein